MIFSKETETAQKEDDEESSREIRNDGDSPSQMVFDEVPSMNSDVRTGSLSASSSSLFPSRTRSSDANLQEVRRKRNMDVRIRRGSPPFLQWNEDNTDGVINNCIANI